MENLYLIVVLSVLIVIIMRIISASIKKNKANKNVIHYNPSSKNVELLSQNISKKMTVSKNKWLHPEDGFDEMRKGMVFDSKIYERNTNESENNAFEIIE